jgi:peptidoglycan hydrolase CwlO-like protein
MGVWQFKIRTLRKKLRGWSRNRDAELKRNKTKILKDLDELDAKVELI